MDYKTHLYLPNGKGKMIIEIRNPETGAVRKKFTLDVVDGEIYRVEVYGNVHEI